MKNWKEVSPYSGMAIEEDAPTTSAGSGQVHGIGVGPYGEPGVDPKKKKKRVAKASLIDLLDRKRFGKGAVKNETV